MQTPGVTVLRPPLDGSARGETGSSGETRSSMRFVGDTMGQKISVVPRFMQHLLLQLFLKLNCCKDFKYIKLHGTKIGNHCLQAQVSRRHLRCLFLFIHHINSFVMQNEVKLRLQAYHQEPQPLFFIFCHCDAHEVHNQVSQWQALKTPNMIKIKTSD